MLLGEMADELRRASVSVRHMEKLVDYLERCPALALANIRTRDGMLRYQYIWDRVALNLNKLDARVKKSGKAWSRYWIEWKSKIRYKYIQYQRLQAAGNGNSIEFTSCEERLLKILTDSEGNLLPSAMFLKTVDLPNVNNNNNSTDQGVSNQNNMNDEYIIKQDEDPLQVPQKKTIEELRRELVEFEITKQKELFELEKKQKREKHEMDMAILELRRQLLVKELDKT